MASRKTKKKASVRETRRTIITTTSTITVQCVYNKRHVKVLDAMHPNSMMMPLCDIDGGPMIAIKATTRR